MRRWRPSGDNSVMTADCKSKRRQLRFFLPAAVVAALSRIARAAAQTKTPHSHDPSDWPRSYPVSLHFKDAPLSRVIQELKSHGPPNVEFEYDILNREGLSTARFRSTLTACRFGKPLRNSQSALDVD